MKQYLILTIILLSILIGGCGGGTDNNSTTPTRMKGKLYYDSSQVKHPKVALIILDTSDNWATTSTSKEISNNSQGWGSGNYSFLLPLIKNSSVYGILPYDDVNENEQFDEIDNEGLVQYIDYFARYDAATNRWTAVDYNDNFLGNLPNYSVNVDLSYVQTNGLSKTNIQNLKQRFKILRLKVEGR